MPARLLALYTPAGPERAFRAIVERMQAGSPPTREQMIAICAEYDIVDFGPARMRVDD